MIRMLGVISGAAIAIVLLTWFVGVPQFTSERPVADVPLAAVDTVNPGMPPIALPAPPAEDDAVAAESAPAEAIDEERQEPREPEIGEPASAPATVPPPTTVATANVPDMAFEAESASEPDLQWFAFWSPFRSRIAAEGFVSQLQRVTGLDYRVVKVKPGVYEVAFAYSGNDEIDLNLSTISAATGLDLPGER